MTEFHKTNAFFDHAGDGARPGQDRASPGRAADVRAVAASTSPARARLRGVPHRSRAPQAAQLVCLWPHPGRYGKCPWRALGAGSDLARQRLLSPFVASRTNSQESGAPLSLRLRSATMRRDCGTCQPWNGHHHRFKPDCRHSRTRDGRSSQAHAAFYRFNVLPRHGGRTRSPRRLRDGIGRRGARGAQSDRHAP